MEKVLYEELFPDEFAERIKKMPVAFLPLGTLEWHGPHMPLGADGIQSKELFIELAGKMGGVVLPMLFVEPFSYAVTNYNCKIFTEGDFKCIFARNCEVTEQLQFMNKMYAITIYSHGFFISASDEYAVLQRSGEERNSPVVPESTVLPYVPPQRNGCNLQNGHTAVPVRRRWLSAVRSVHKV